MAGRRGSSGPANKNERACIHETHSQTSLNAKQHNNNVLISITQNARGRRYQIFKSLRVMLWGLWSAYYLLCMIFEEWEAHSFRIPKYCLHRLGNEVQFILYIYVCILLFFLYRAVITAGVFRNCSLIKRKIAFQL